MLLAFFLVSRAYPQLPRMQTPPHRTPIITGISPHCSHPPRSHPRTPCYRSSPRTNNGCQKPHCARPPARVQCHQHFPSHRTHVKPPVATALCSITAVKMVEMCRCGPAPFPCISLVKVARAITARAGTKDQRTQPWVVREAGPGASLQELLLAVACVVPERSCESRPAHG